jgi:enoyl-[acyl-carrier protein] reductase/trans-2-enoyl-CoA reductase (NAD+)
MKPEVQQTVKELWEQTSTENLTSIAAVDEYRNDFFRLFGFGFAGVDYEKDIPSLKKIPSINE